MPGIEARAPERTETSSGFFTSPNFIFMDFSTSAQGRFDLFLQRVGVFPAIGVVMNADIRDNGETGGYRQAQIGHFGEIRALSAEQFLHRGIAVSLVWRRNYRPICVIRELPEL
jgi:hypothetical protein